MGQQLKDIISNNLKRLRKERNKTMVEIAEVLGVSQSTISAWESGRYMPRAGHIEQLSRYYNVLKSDILNEHIEEVTEEIKIKTENKSIDLQEILRFPCEVTFSTHVLTLFERKTIRRLLYTYFSDDIEEDESKDWDILDRQN